MKTNFPVIRDVDEVLAGECRGTSGGIMTIKPPGYALAVTNPDDSSPDPEGVVISAKGALPEIVTST